MSHGRPRNSTQDNPQGERDPGAAETSSKGDVPVDNFVRMLLAPAKKKGETPPRMTKADAALCGQARAAHEAGADFSPMALFLA